MKQTTCKDCGTTISWVRSTGNYASMRPVEPVPLGYPEREVETVAMLAGYLKDGLPKVSLISPETIKRLERDLEWQESAGLPHDDFALSVRDGTFFRLHKCERRAVAA